MPPLQQSLTINLLRVALWWQKWQRTGNFNTFHVIFGAEMLFFSSFFFLLRCLLAPVKVPSRSFESAFSLSFPWGGTISSMGWSNKRNGTSLRLQKKETNFFVLCSTFSNFATKVAKILRLDKKRNRFLCFVLDFSYLCTILKQL